MEIRREIGDSTGGDQRSEDNIRDAKLTKLKEFHRYGQIMMEITLKDLENMSDGANLLAILLKQYENIRFDSF